MMQLVLGLVLIHVSFILSALGAPANRHGLASNVPSVMGRRSPNVQTPLVISLTRESVTSPRSRQTKNLQAVDHGNEIVGIAPLTAYQDILYFTDITFGTETFKVVVDTGSSDTWLVQTGFQCVDGSTGIYLPETECAFGPLYTPSSTFKQIQGENFNTRYNDGESLTGSIGTEDVTLGGITVKDQEFGLVNYAAWRGDNSSSGLLGLAFPNVTKAFLGSDPTVDGNSNVAPYSPLFTNMYAQGLIAPVFSLAISRDDRVGGLLALGGLPPVKHDSYFVCTPFQLRPRPGLPATNTTDKPLFQFYYIKLGGVTYGNTTDNSTSLATVDSGTSLIFLPSELAHHVNQQFDPPAYIDGSRGEYVVDCAAKPPRFGIGIRGHTFYVNPMDMIIKTKEGGCITGITAAGFNRPAVLGDVFLRNVLAVFDVGASEMRFAARENY